MFLDAKNKFPILEIKNRKIGLAYDPFLITEIGINHDGSLSKAKELVDLALSSGAECIKVQLHFPDSEMTKEAKNVKPGNADASIYDVISSRSLTKDQELDLRNYVASKNLIYGATPFSLEAVNFLRELNPDFIKIGSGEIEHIPLIEKTLEYKKPMILSTGMQDCKSLIPAVTVLREKQIPFALLHCTNLYPMPAKLARLEGIRELMKEFPDAVVGYSDHSNGNVISIGAVALGAAIIERHFVSSHLDNGPDVEASVDPVEFSELISQMRIIADARGGHKYRSEEEEVTYKFARSSVVASRNIKAGEFFTLGNLWAKRPGDGDFSVAVINELYGKKASRDIVADEQIAKSDVE
jgi:N-acetylneuraminate synthase